MVRWGIRSWLIVKLLQDEKSNWQFLIFKEMKRREFVVQSGIVGVGLVGLSLASCKSDTDQEKNSTGGGLSKAELPALGYALNALEPMIDERTMGIHHGKHHAGYVKKLNAALESYSGSAGSLNEMLAGLSDKDSDLGLRNNGGGHYNHSLFWNVMKPGGADAPTGELSEAINAAFNDFDSFKERLGTAAATRFGSGWAWLSVNDKKELFVSSTPNQDNPLMKNLVEESGTPILGIDVWEHAYYLKYQNKRKEYIGNWMKLINWDVVQSSYSALS